MPQVHCYLPDKTVDKLEEIQSTEGHESLSKAIKEVIDLGIKVYFFNKDNEEKNNEICRMGWTKNSLNFYYKIDLI